MFKLEFIPNTEKIAKSKLGIGTWGLGGKAYGEISAEKAIELIRCSIKNGIAVIDTAPLYGNGRAEELIGLALKNYSLRPKLITKFGLNEVNYLEKRNYTFHSMIDSLEKSSARMGFSPDIILVHSPTIPELSTLLDELKDQDYSEFEKLGVSLISPIQIRDLLQIFPNCKTIETNFSLMDQRILSNTPDDLNKCLIIARTILNYGFLSDKNVNIENISASKNHLNRFTQDILKRWDDERKLWKEIASFNSLSLESLATIFVNSHSFIGFSVTGVMNTLELTQLFETAQLGFLSQDSLQEIHEYKRRIDYELGELSLKSKVD